MALTFLDLVKACDNYPHVDIPAQAYTPDDSEGALYQLLLPNDERPHGFMLPSTVKRMPWTPAFRISGPGEIPRVVQVLDSSNGEDTASACNAAFAEVIQAAIVDETFQGLTHRPNPEDYRILGAARRGGAGRIQLRRAAAALFGIASRGAHMTVFTREPATRVLKIWVPRRSAHLRTWPGKLDTTVAGGIRAEESPLECILHEADEEASLPSSLVREKAVPCGAITYVAESGQGSGSEFGLCVPDILYVYDLEVGPDVVPRPHDDEVETFTLMSVDEVKEALVREEFKTNCASVMIDFFVRHGIITDDNEPDYLDIVTRLHRALPVPTSGSGE
jgi:8-oxo-dGTP pyrophosphatase MutT (NUDIX family)